MGKKMIFIKRMIDGIQIKLKSGLLIINIDYFYKNGNCRIFK